MVLGWLAVLRTFEDNDVMENLRKNLKSRNFDKKTQCVLEHRCLVLTVIPLVGGQGGL